MFLGFPTGDSHITRDLRDDPGGTPSIRAGVRYPIYGGYPSHCDIATFQTRPLEPRPRWRENITLPRPLAH